MSKAVSRGQALAVSASIAVDTFWDEVDGDSLQKNFLELTPKQRGEKFTLFLKNDGNIIRKQLQSISVSRAPITLLDSIYRGYGGGRFTDNLLVCMQDERAAEIKHINLYAIQFLNLLRSEEGSIKGYKLLARVREQGHIPLDFNILMSIWEMRHKLPFYWKEMCEYGSLCLLFPGTVFAFTHPTNEHNKHLVNITTSVFGLRIQGGMWSLERFMLVDTMPKGYLIAGISTT